MKARPLPSLEYLNECFELSEESPSGLIWKTRPYDHFPTKKVWEIMTTRYEGKIAGCIRTGRKEYWCVRCGGSLYQAHRIVYSMRHNVVLALDIEIDHKDNNGLNNRHNNLREASSFDNQQNRPANSNNTTGVKGVFHRKSNNTYFGRVRHNGIYYSTGSSPSKEIITEMVRELRESLHKQFTNHG